MELKCELKEFIENHRKEYLLDKNSLDIDEFEVVKLENLDQLLKLFSMECEIYNVEGSESIKLVNGKYLIITEKFTSRLKEIFLNILKKYENQIDALNEDDLISLLVLCNYILCFTSEFLSIYNLKKYIFGKIKNSRCSILLNELNFINLISKKFRKSSLSWDYRKFLIRMYAGEQNDEYLKNMSPEKKKNLNEKFTKFYNSNNSIAKLFLNKEINSDHIIICEIMMIHEINELNNRNYYLWGYLAVLLSLFKANKNIVIFIFSFVFSVLAKYNLDYSCYSFIVNKFEEFRSYFPKYDELVLYFNKISVKNENTKYLKEIIKLLEK